MEQGDEVLFYRTDLYEEHLGKTQLGCGASSDTPTIGQMIFLNEAFLSLVTIEFQNSDLACQFLQ